MVDAYRRNFCLGTWRIFYKLNSLHSTIKFTAEYSKETIKFLDANIRLVRRSSLQICLLSLTIHASSYIHPLLPLTTVRRIPYSQALKLNRIRSDNESFDKGSNNSEGWL